MNLQKPEVEQHGSDYWLQQIAADQGEETAVLVEDALDPAPQPQQQQLPIQQEQPQQQQEVDPGPQPTNKLTPEQPVQQEAQPAPEPQPKQQEPAPQEVNKKPIDIPDIFPDNAPPAKPQVNIDAEIEKRVNARLDQFLKDYEIVEEDEEGNETTRPLTEQDNTPDIRQAIREEWTAIREQERVAAANKDIESKYTDNFFKSLDNQDVKLSKIETNYVKDSLEKAKNYVRQQVGRELAPEEMIEVTKWHREQMIGMLNEKGYSAPAPKANTETLSPINKTNSEQPQAEMPVSNPNQPRPLNTIQDIEAEAARLEQTQGELLPSQVSALQKRYMQVTGKRQARFGI